MYVFVCDITCAFKMCVCAGVQEGNVMNEVLDGKGL